MQFYDYIYRDSIVHKLDPRNKIAWLVSLSFLVFIATSRAAILALFGVVLVTILISRLPLSSVWNSSKVFVVLFTLAYMVLFSLLLWNFKQGIVEGFFFSLK